MAVSDSIAVIQATLAPAFLISGTGILLNFTQTRLFRVIDRARALERDGAAAAAIEPVLHRARILRNAVATGVTTVALTVVTAILLMAGDMFDLPSLASAAPYAFGLSMVALFVALCLVLWDTILSVRSVSRQPRENPSMQR